MMQAWNSIHYHCESAQGIWTCFRKARLGLQHNVLTLINSCIERHSQRLPPQFHKLGSSTEEGWPVRKLTAYTAAGIKDPILWKLWKIYLAKVNKITSTGCFSNAMFLLFFWGWNFPWKEKVLAIHTRVSQNHLFQRTSVWLNCDLLQIWAHMFSPVAKRQLQLSEGLDNVNQFFLIWLPSLNWISVSCTFLKMIWRPFDNMYFLIGGWGGWGGYGSYGGSGGSGGYWGWGGWRGCCKYIVVRLKQ